MRLVKFSDEDIMLRAAPGAHGKLRLNVSYFSRWHAYRDGQPLPITVSFLPEAPNDTGFISVPLSAGRYRFVFERTLTDRLAMPIGAVGIACCLLLLFGDRRALRFAFGKRMLDAVQDRLDALSARPGTRGACCC